MVHPYHGHKSLHTERLGKMLGAHKAESRGRKGHKANAEVHAMAKSAHEHGMHGNKAKHRMDKYARGGRTKGKTQININVMPSDQNQAPPMMIPPAMPAGLGAPPAPPPAPKPPMPQMGAGMPPGMPPGAPPPGMMRKRGGRASNENKIAAEAVHKHERHLHKGEKETKLKRGGRAKDGPAYQEGLRNGTKVQHAGQNDRKDINRPPVITKKGGGRIYSEKMHSPTIEHAAGGGLGRLEKIGLYGK